MKISVLKRSIFGLLPLALLAAVVALMAFSQHSSFGAALAVLLFGAGVAGTIVATPVEVTNSWKTWNITCDDADTATSFAHGFGMAPDAAWLQSELDQSAATSMIEAWGLTVDATNVNLTKQNLTDSGGDTPGTSVVAKVFAWRPHSGAR